ncbi:Protein of unknown function [Collimonas sp. OK307]|uniref:DUF3460 family protein n=1 Tax=Collimonas sp. OK307 TaxID=1801620 RepID=UPI0008EF756F|nr:DUF3460 family protein [Collimonas sp. OK307]SFH85570.1 Protein of unknown function [Collimonas sp. OK307]
MFAKQKGYKAGHEGYVSEITQFLDKFLEEHPEVIDEQSRGWHIFWDRDVDLGELKKADEDSVPAKPYYYS